MTEQPAVTGPGLHEYPMRRSCPYHPPTEYAELAGQGPLAEVRLFDGSTAWLVTRHREARAMFADAAMFSSDHDNPAFPILAERERNFPEFTQELFGLDGERHRARRRMLLPRFTAKQVERLRPMIQRMADELIGELLGLEPPVDLIAVLGRPLPSRVICRMLGISYEEHELFEVHAQGIMQAPDLEQAVAAGRELLDYLVQVVDAKRKNLGDDLLSTLVTERLNTGELTSTEVSKLMVALLIGGQETTTSMIGLGTLTLLQHPDQLAEIRENPELLPGAVEELMRFLSIADLTTLRVATADVEVAGRTVKEGDGVILSTAAANRDAAVFDDADTFDIHRDTQGHLGFGHGPHRCLGENLARAELEILFGTLFERIPTLRLAVPMDEVSMKVGMTLEGLHDLPVTW
ncbi:pentalenic acid synthase [Streptomyces sp. V3I8]|jgi:pentalenic acid synthase|uniref:cytochrome P450 n=1 Tax=Streptomyces sp. V3I8 TaxID=3042279 RepID=UPI002785205D|nr:cytochrome P450 [Streptomyces sp. V3I8]MDQ1034671.1 pentalenic acid synthase [Streptomyces sp. V3I8]